MGRHILLAYKSYNNPKCQYFSKVTEASNQNSQVQPNGTTFISNLDMNVTFFHQDDPAFCPEKKGETLDNEKRERTFQEALVENAKNRSRKDQNESFFKNLTL
jgi:hypothetical protein